MQNQEMVRKVLKTIGVNSIGMYVVNGKTNIALHCESESSRNDAKEFLQPYLEGEVIL